VSEGLGGARREASVLADFDAGDVLDALSLGVIVLDLQLCAVYANVGAEDLLAVPAERLRGRPLATFLPQPQCFLQAVERALARGETVAFDLAGCAGSSAGGIGTLSLRVAPMRDQLSGRHLMLELWAARCRIEPEPVP
jgi:nitrogen-specific signal transduction histidine kinase